MEKTFRFKKLLDGAKKIAKGDTVSCKQEISSDKRQELSSVDWMEKLRMRTRGTCKF